MWMRSRACHRPFTWGHQAVGARWGDYLRLDGILAQIMLEEGQMHCLDCGGLCRSYAADEVEREVARVYPDTRCLVTGPVGFAEQGDVAATRTGRVYRGSQSTVRSSGWKATGQAVPSGESEVHVVVDRLVPDPDDSVRFLEAVRVSRSISVGQTVVWADGASEMMHLNQQPTCGECGRQYEPLAAADFGAGPQVTLHGRTMDALMDAPPRLVARLAGQGRGTCQNRGRACRGLRLGAGTPAVEPPTRIAGGGRVAAPAISVLSQQRSDGHPLHF